MFGLSRSLEGQRKQALKKASHPVMQEYLAEPFPSPKWRSNDLNIVSLDFETTGLDPQRHQILSFGKIELSRGAIVLSTAQHGFIRADGPIPEASAIIHQILDDQASRGQSLEDVMPELLRVLRGKVMLVHYNRIEQGFLDAACRRLYGSPFLIPTIDTLQLAHRVLSLRNHAVEPARLRLFNLREDFKLPRYKAHNALCDALTTAELFLALEGEISPSKPAKLTDLML